MLGHDLGQSASVKQLTSTAATTDAAALRVLSLPMTLEKNDGDGALLLFADMGKNLLEATLLVTPPVVLFRAVIAICQPVSDGGDDDCGRYLRVLRSRAHERHALPETPRCRCIVVAPS